jgi:hypothetical protein
MSDNWIVLIPQDPRVIPAPERRERALQVFRKLVPDAERVGMEVTDEVQFIDCGGNFERVLCPDCGEVLDHSWWSERVDDDFATGFQLKQFELPCCATKQSLDGLRYEWAQGFARFSMEAMNPNLAELSPAQIASVEAVLGSRLRIIYRHI